MGRRLTADSRSSRRARTPAAPKARREGCNARRGEGHAALAQAYQARWREGRGAMPRGALSGCSKKRREVCRMLTSINTAGMPAARAPNVCPPGVPKGQRTTAWGRQRRMNTTSGVKNSMDFCASARSAAKSSGVANGAEPKPHLALQTALKPSKAGASLCGASQQPTSAAASLQLQRKRGPAELQ